jgi:NitT/TauT family transport system substrate-binding protein
MPTRKHLISRRNVLAGGGAMLGGMLYPSGATLAAPASIPVSIANASGNLNLTMQELMKRQGFLEEMRLAPTITNVADGAKITGSLIGGDADLTTMTGFGQVFPAIEKGARLKILAGAGLLSTLAIYSAKPDVKTLKDLEGRTVGTGAPGSLLHQLVVAALQKNGLDHRKVTFVNVGASGDVFRAVTVGTVDAGLGEAAIADHVSRANLHMIDGGDLAIGLPEYTFQGAFATDRAIASKRDLIVRTLAAYAKLYRFVTKPDAKEAFLKARGDVLKSATREESESQWNWVQKYKPFAVDLVLGEERMAYMQRLNVQLGIQKSVLPYAQVCDPSLAKEAIALIS